MTEAITPPSGGNGGSPVPYITIVCQDSTGATLAASTGDKLNPMLRVAVAENGAGLSNALLAGLAGRAGGSTTLTVVDGVARWTPPAATLAFQFLLVVNNPLGGTFRGYSGIFNAQNATPLTAYAGSSIPVQTSYTQASGVGLPPHHGKTTGATPQGPGAGVVVYDDSDYAPTYPEFIVASSNVNPAATQYYQLNPMRTVYGLVWDGIIEVKIWRWNGFSFISPNWLEGTPPLLDVSSPPPNQVGEMGWIFPDGEWISKTSQYNYHVWINLTSASGNVTVRLDVTAAQFVYFLNQTQYLVVPGKTSPPPINPIRLLHDFVWGLMGEF